MKVCLLMSILWCSIYATARCMYVACRTVNESQIIVLIIFGKLPTQQTSILC